MKNFDYLPIIGIEVHVELRTKSKMFCGCSAHHFRVKPNIHACPVCLGLPGALPVPNLKAIEWCLMIGKTLNCKLAKVSKFDRKNYFYPDLPKGYQISQYDQPFCKNGFIKLKTISQNLKTIRINRVHLEEDTAKLLHQAVEEGKASLIDFNRSGVPLVEVVSEPDINSSEEAVIYLKKLQQIIRSLGVSNCDMEKGSMRCEVNISLAQSSELKAQSLPPYKVEVKNINSFRFVKKAIGYEIERQKKILATGGLPVQETRGYSEKSNRTFSQRTKEEAHDYRYFPEPDIPPIRIKNLKLKIKNLPELPDQKKERFIKEYGLSEYNAQILTRTTKIANFFEKAAKLSQEPQKIAQIIINKRVDINKFSPQQLVNYLQKQKITRITNQQQLRGIIHQILINNKRAVSDYKNGKREVLGFLTGQVMRETKGKADAQLVQKLLLEKLKAQP